MSYTDSKLVIGKHELLHQAIDKLGQERLRRVFKIVCDNVLEAERKACQELLLEVKRVDPHSGFERSNTDGDAKHVTTGRKRTFADSAAIDDTGFCPRYARCKNCEEEFDITEQEEGCCRWHSGEKEVNDKYDFEILDDFLGLPEDELDNPDYQEGMTWTCCEGVGNAEGCKKTRHMANSSYVSTAGKRAKSSETGERPAPRIVGL